MFKLILFLGLMFGAIALVGEKRIERSTADSKQWAETQRASVAKWIADGRR